MAFAFCTSAFAAYIADSYDDTKLVGFTDYGWVTFNISLSYTENYTSGTNSNAFTSRTFYFFIKASNNTNPASFTYGDIIHYDGSGNVAGRYALTDQAAVFPGDGWVYGYKVNNTKLNFSKTTGFTGHIGCDISDVSCITPVIISLDLAFKNAS